MRRNGGGRNLSPKSIDSDNSNRADSLHSSHEGTACGPFIMDTSNLTPRQYFDIECNANTCPVVTSTPTHVGAIKKYKYRRLGLRYQGILSCSASRETILSLLSISTWLPPGCPPLLRSISIAVPPLAEDVMEAVLPWLWLRGTNAVSSRSGSCEGVGYVFCLGLNRARPARTAY